MKVHSKRIKKGKLGEFSKIQEEYKELKDTLKTQDRDWQFQEAHDLLEAINCFLDKHYKDLNEKQKLK